MAKFSYLIDVEEASENKSRRDCFALDIVRRNRAVSSVVERLVYTSFRAFFAMTRCAAWPKTIVPAIITLSPVWTQTAWKMLANFEPIVALRSYFHQTNSVPLPTPLQFAVYAEPFADNVSTIADSESLNGGMPVAMISVLCIRQLSLDRINAPEESRSSRIGSLSAPQPAVMAQSPARLLSLAARP